MSAPRTIVFDIETKREFAEVGGAQNRHLLGVSVIGCFDSADGEFRTFLEGEVLAFGKVLRAATLVVGFNSTHFDLPVLQPYLPFDTSKLPSLDLMVDLERVLGHRVSLDACAQATLGTGKTGDGVQAIRWFREGKIDEVKQYCLDDVRITRDLYEYGKANGQVFFVGKDGSKRAVPVTWGGAAVDRVKIRQVLEGAHRTGKRVEIEYVSMVAATGQQNRNRRTIDIIRMSGDTVDAYCHLRKDTRRFTLDRITDATALDEVADPRFAVGQRALL